MDTTLIILITTIPASILVIFIGLFMVFKSKNVKKTPRINVNDEFITNLINLYGGIDNINHVETENSRLRITVNDLDLVKLDELKPLANGGIFVTGNVVKTLYRIDSEEIKNLIEKRR